MKKILILSLALFVTQISAFTLANEVKPNETKKPTKEEIIQMKKAREAAFEQKLGLTEAQKVQAKEIRMKSREKIKPVIEELKAKKQEAEAVKKSRMAVQMQEEKLTVLDAEIKVLEKKVMEIKKQNMKDFESILTSKQKKILKQMKKEGRKKFSEQH